MFKRIVKTGLMIFLFIFTTGFMPLPALIGPGLTIASSGNIYKAAAQILIDREVKNKTGKNSLAYVKEEVKKQHQKNNLDEDFKNLIESRVKIFHEKLAQQNNQKNINNDLILLVEKRISVARTKISKIKINQ